MTPTLGPLDALSFFASALRTAWSAAAHLKEERERVREVVDEAYTLVDGALVLGISRLRDVLRAPDADFLGEAQALDDFGAWLDLERGVRLCQNLRAAGRELQTLPGKLTATLALHDRAEVERLADQLLRGESAVADALTSAFADIAHDARKAGPADVAALRERARTRKDDLQALRRGLVQEQVEMLRVI
jgi:hypothetical protein